MIALLQTNKVIVKIFVPHRGVRMIVERKTGGVRLQHIVEDPG